MTKEIDQLYKDARKAYKNLDVDMKDLSGAYFAALKWILEVTLGVPEHKLQITYEPVVTGKVDKRFYLEVTYRIIEEDYLIKIFNNNEIAFSREASLDLATKITAAFKKWCELIDQRVFRGGKI